MERTHISGGNGVKKNHKIKQGIIDLYNSFIAKENTENQDKISSKDSAKE